MTEIINITVTYLVSFLFFTIEVLLVISIQVNATMNNNTVSTETAHFNLGQLRLSYSSYSRNSACAVLRV